MSKRKSCPAAPWVHGALPGGEVGPEARFSSPRKRLGALRRGRRANRSQRSRRWCWSRHRKQGISPCFYWLLVRHLRSYTPKNTPRLPTLGDQNAFSQLPVRKNQWAIGVRPRSPGLSTSPRPQPRRYWCRFASARALPSGVRGPVLHPPCHLHRRLPGSAFARQGCPLPVLAPHVRRAVAFA